GTGAAFRRQEEILHFPLSAAAGRVARFPATDGAGRRHHTLRISQEVGAQFRLGPDRHRDEGQKEFRGSAETFRRGRMGLSGYHRKRDDRRPDHMSGEKVFIILFRGVGGKTQLPVKPLREALSAAGFKNVATYINSGNAVVKSGLSREKVIAKVAGICAREFEFRKDIHALTRADWAELVANNPFPEAVAMPKLLHAAVLAAVP